MKGKSIVSANTEKFISAHPDPKVKESWEKVVEDGVIISKDEDAANRPKFVGGIQACYESSITELLASHHLYGAVCVIHTKLPPTPLRTDGVVLAEGLICSEIADDPQRLQTVLVRPDILRSFLAAGGRLVAAYPENSSYEDIPGIGIYNALLEIYPNNLINHPIQELPDQYSGATCLTQDENNDLTLFSIAATQATSPGNEMGVWFGPLVDNPRFTFINEFLIGQGIDLMGELASSAEYLKSIMGEHSEILS